MGKSLMSPCHPNGPSTISGLNYSSPGSVDNETAAEMETSTSNDNHASEIGVLTFNATGELRYLGPSSGTSILANAAAAIMKSSKLPSEGISGRGPPPSYASAPSTDQRQQSKQCKQLQQPNLPHGEIQLLRASYEMWVHPIYPLFTMDTLDCLIAHGEKLCCVAEYSEELGPSTDQDNNNHRNSSNTAMFYFIMALGATSRSNTIRQMQMQGYSDFGRTPPHDDTASGSSLLPLPSAYLYALALQHSHLDTIKPSVAFVQLILLICIYSSHGAVGLSQWQLAGLAMRTAIELGLHSASKARGVTMTKETDQRSRVFWVAYSIEITLAYNLGRPPSIGEEHITMPLPSETVETIMASQHMKHRRIQSRLISRVYCSGMSLGLEHHQRHDILSKLQSELDEWMSLLPTACKQDAGTTPYPRQYWERLYHGTVYVLHRASPLFPQPLEESLERCIRHAGAYIVSVTETLRGSNVPLTWMLIQGVLFAGHTMLMTAKMSYRRLATRAPLSLFLVDLPAWSRKCSVCLAIVTERWKDALLSRLEAQFDLVANDTLNIISNEIKAKTVTENANAPLKDSECVHGCPGVSANYFSVLDTAVATEQQGTPSNGPNVHPSSTITGFGRSGPGEDFDLFQDFLGIDEMQSFWDIGVPGMNFGGDDIPLPYQ